MSLYQNKTYEQQHSPSHALQNDSQDAALTLEPTAIMAYLVAHILDVLCHLVTSSQDANPLTDTDASISTKPIDKNHYFQLLLIGEITSTQILAIALQRSIGLNDTLLGQQISITTLGIQEFTQVNFVQRYDLGCFIHPHLSLSDLDLEETEVDDDVTELDLPKLNKTKVNNAILVAHESLNPPPDTNQKSTISTDPNLIVATPLSEAQFKLVAMRLRDLFAHQSLLFMPVVIDKPASANLPKKASLSNVSGISNICFDNLGYTLTATHVDVIRPPVICWQFNLYDYKPQPAWLNSKYWANPENFDKFRW